jgi:uncharacterized protein (TIGR02466 family)
MITNFFPLSVYKEKLGLDKEARDKMAAVVLQQSEETTSGNAHRISTWTGDVHGRATLHLRDEFAPLVAGLHRHMVTFLTQLGHKTDAIDLYITRCWGTVSVAQQAVATHNHRNSALSIVYYLSLPEGSASLAFHNREIQNEISPGFAHPDRVRSGKVDPRNPLSVMIASIAAEEDDILIFPSAAFHGVNPGRQSQPRISIAADTLIVENELSGEEYLLPPLATWKKMP